MIKRIRIAQKRVSGSLRCREMPLARLCLTSTDLLASISGSTAQGIRPARASDPFPDLQASTPTPPSLEDGHSVFDPLRPKGWTVPLPPPVDTVDQRVFGVRDALADLGIGYIGFANDSLHDDTVRHDLPASGVRGR